MTEDVYTKLALHLDEMPIGAPMSDELIKILSILFSPEEAELATGLPFMNPSLEQLSRITGMPVGELEAMLDGMVSKGIVFRREKGAR